MSLQIPVEKIKPSPYQPRLEFDLEDLKGSILKDGILVPITVRERNGYYELIDGERRTRLARELGYSEIPANIIDVDDSTARRMVWKVNTLRKDYKPQEKACFFKLLQEEGLSLAGIARDYLNNDTSTVRAYLNVFKLPEDWQKQVWDREIAIGVIKELSSLFNGQRYLSPNDHPQVFDLLKQTATQKHFSQKEVQEAMRPYLIERRAKQVEAAKDVLETIDPTIEITDKPEDLIKAATALKKEATRKIKEQKTPEQIEAEKAEKLRKKQEREAKKKKAQAKKEKKLAEKIRQEITKEVKQEAKQEAKKELVENPEFIDTLIEENKELFEEKIQKRREEADQILKKRFALKQEEEKPTQKTSKLEDQYLSRIQNTFLEITSWNLSLWIGLGTENREKAYNYFQAINQWTQWLINLKDDRNAAEPDITSIAKDMPKPIEAEFKVVD